MPAIRHDELILRILKDLNDVRSALRRVAVNLPLFDIANENTPAQLTTDQNNYVIGNYDNLRMSSSAAVTITGLRGGMKGRSLKIFNVGSFAITFSNENASSDAANRMSFVSNINRVVLPDSSIVLYYDSTQSRWIEGTPLEDTSILKETTQAITADQNNYNPSDYGVLRLSSDAARTITGISGGVQGRSLKIFNVGSYEITISHQSASSSAANRIISPTGTDIILNPNGELALYYDSTTARWRTSYNSNANRITVELQLSGAQSISDATYEQISWSSVIQDTGNFFDVLNPTYVTIPETGWYQITLHVAWDINGTNLRESLLERSTSVPYGNISFDSRMGVSGASTNVELARLEYFDAGDRIYATVWQNSGGALSVNVNGPRASASTLIVSKM